MFDCVCIFVCEIAIGLNSCAKFVFFSGAGSFGDVNLVWNKIDGRFYAVKMLDFKKGNMRPRDSLKEIWAHAVLGQSIYIIR